MTTRAASLHPSHCCRPIFPGPFPNIRSDTTGFTSQARPQKLPFISLLFSSIWDSSTCLAPLFPVCLFPVTRCAPSFVPGLYIYEQSPHLLPRTGARENLHARARACEPLKFRVSSASLFFCRKKKVQAGLHPDNSELYSCTPETHLGGCRATWRIPPPGDPAWTG